MPRRPPLPPPPPPQLTASQAERFYGEHKGKAFFPGLVAFMTSGPIWALVLSKVDAVKAWRQLMGPTNTQAAREAAPRRWAGQRIARPPSGAVWSVLTRGCALHDSTCCLSPWREHTPARIERALKMTASTACSLRSPSTASARLPAPPLPPPFRPRPSAKRSLRALYGTDGTRNATHGSDSAGSAAREARFFFPRVAAAEPMPPKQADEYIRMQLEPSLLAALTALAKQKCAAGEGEALTFLAKHLLENNPNKGRRLPAPRQAPPSSGAQKGRAPAKECGLGDDDDWLEAAGPLGVVTSMVAETRSSSSGGQAGASSSGGRAPVASSNMMAAEPSAASMA
jgi:nucleoside diphosphate kinase